MNEDLEKYKGIINKNMVAYNLPICACNKEDWQTMANKHIPGYDFKNDVFSDGMEDDDMLIIVDNLELLGESTDEFLSGAYILYIEDNEVIMEWLPYPEQPIKGIDNIVKHLIKTWGMQEKPSVMEWIKNWTKCNQRQLHLFVEKYKGTQITMGFNQFRITGGHMGTDEDYDHVAYVDLINVKDNVVDITHLSTISNDYVNYSAIGAEEQIELLKKLMICN